MPPPYSPATFAPSAATPPYTPPLRGRYGGLPLPRSVPPGRVNAATLAPLAAGAARVITAPAAPSRRRPDTLRGQGCAGAGPSSPAVIDTLRGRIPHWAAGGRFPALRGRDARTRSAGFFAAHSAALLRPPPAASSRARAVVLLISVSKILLVKIATPQDFHTMGNILE